MIEPIWFYIGAGIVLSLDLILHTIKEWDTYWDLTRPALALLVIGLLVEYLQ